MAKKVEGKWRMISNDNGIEYKAKFGRGFVYCKTYNHIGWLWNSCFILNGCFSDIEVAGNKWTLFNYNFSGKKYDSSFELGKELEYPFDGYMYKVCQIFQSYDDQRISR